MAHPDDDFLDDHVEGERGERDGAAPCSIEKRTDRCALPFLFLGESGRAADQHATSAHVTAATVMAGEGGEKREAAAKMGVNMGLKRVELQG